MFIRAMVRIFSFGERWNVPFNTAVASLNRTFHPSPHENILVIPLINIHYLYTMQQYTLISVINVAKAIWIYVNELVVDLSKSSVISSDNR